MGRRFRISVLALWLATSLGLTAAGTVLGIRLVGKPFPGFLVQPLVYVSPFQLPGWDLARLGLKPLDRVLAADGESVANAAVLSALAERLPVGTAITYRVVRDGAILAIRVPTRRFEWADFFQTYGALAALSWTISAIGMVVLCVRGAVPAARALATATACLGLTGLLYFDFNTGGLMARLFLAIYPFSGAAFLALARTFPPRPEERVAPRWALWGPWVIAGAFVAVFQVTFIAAGPAAAPAAWYDASFSSLLLANLWLMAGFAVLIGSLAVRVFLAPKHSLARQQAALALLGAGAGFAPFVLWALLFTTAGTPPWPLAIALHCFAAFPLALAVAIVRTQLFDISVVIRNSVLYTFLSTLLAAIYVLTATTIRLLTVGSASNENDMAAQLLATGLVVALFAPLRDRLQGVIDRRFFREVYDSQIALEEASQSMTSLLDLDAIVHRMLDTIEQTMRVTSGALMLVADDGSVYMPYGTLGDAVYASLGRDSPVVRELAETLAILTRVQLPVRKSHRVSGNLEALTAELVVPLHIRTQLRGLLILGPKRSDLPFTDQDLRLLVTLAHQSAIALENARAYRRIEAFSAELESKVRERTAELKAAYGELEAAQAKLLHSEKMAAMGRLIAGIAHEINNPLTLISGGVGVLRRRLAPLAEPSDDSGNAALEVPTVLDALQEGVLRVKGIVQHLREASRLDEFELEEVDLLGCLESTLSLIRPGTPEGIVIETRFSVVPPIRGSENHLKQVLTNVMLNACQALDGEGRVVVELGAERDELVVAIRDNGPGMAAEVRHRIFEPFFTTKPPGAGTGLGLAICHAIVERHGGRIEVESAPGEGTTFRLAFPRLAAVLPS